MSIPFFISIPDQFCTECRTKSIILVLSKDKKIAEKFYCKKCRKSYTIDWSDKKHPRPLYMPIEIMIKLRRSK